MNINYKKCIVMIKAFRVFLCLSISLFFFGACDNPDAERQNLLNEKFKTDWMCCALEDSILKNVSLDSLPILIPTGSDKFLHGYLRSKEDSSIYVIFYDIEKDSMGLFTSHICKCNDKSYSCEEPDVCIYHAKYKDYKLIDNYLYLITYPVKSEFSYFYFDVSLPICDIYKINIQDGSWWAFAGMSKKFQFYADGEDLGETTTFIGNQIRLQIYYKEPFDYSGYEDYEENYEKWKKEYYDSIRWMDLSRLSGTYDNNDVESQRLLNEKFKVFKVHDFYEYKYENYENKTPILIPTGNDKLLYGYLKNKPDTWGNYVLFYYDVEKDEMFFLIPPGWYGVRGEESGPGLASYIDYKIIGNNLYLIYNCIGGLYEPNHCRVYCINTTDGSWWELLETDGVYFGEDKTSFVGDSIRLQILYENGQDIDYWDCMSMKYRDSIKYIKLE